MAKPEYRIQTDFVKHVRLYYPDLLMTISPAGMVLSPGMAKISTALGYLKGTPDVMIFEPRGQYHGLFIELKAPGGRISPEQIKVLGKLSSAGYATAVCWSTLAAIEELEKYLKLPTLSHAIGI